MDRRNLAFDRINYILLVVGMVVVVIGYNPDIFSARRIKVAPLVCLIGFVSMIYAVMRKPKDKEVER